MSKYSYEFSYYFGIMVSSVFAFGVALYILFISLYAMLDIYSKIYTFSALVYKYGLNDAATICFKDFAYRFVEASRVDMRKAVVDAPKFIHELSNFYIKNRSDFANFVITEKPSYYPIKLAAIYNGKEISSLLKVIADVSSKIDKQKSDELMKVMSEIKIFDSERIFLNEVVSFIKNSSKHYNFDYKNSAEFLRADNVFLADLKMKMGGVFLESNEKKICTSLHSMCFANSLIEKGELDPLKSFLIFYDSANNPTCLSSSGDSETRLDQALMNMLYLEFKDNIYPYWASPNSPETTPDCIYIDPVTGEPTIFELKSTDPTNFFDNKMPINDKGAVDLATLPNEVREEVLTRGAGSLREGVAKVINLKDVKNKGVVVHFVKAAADDLRVLQGFEREMIDKVEIDKPGTKGNYVFKLLIDDASNERYNQYLIRNEKVEK
jgi:predicted nucleic-acid-binding protein